MSNTLESTFDLFFAEWTEERATEEQQFMREELAEVEAAIKASDWKSLDRLGYATYSYRDNHSVGPEDDNAILTSKQFNQSRFEQLKADISMSPKQLADHMNNAISR